MFLSLILSAMNGKESDTFVSVVWRFTVRSVPIYTSQDNGYTYGGIDYENFREEETEEDEEEEEEE